MHLELAGRARWTAGATAATPAAAAPAPRIVRIDAPCPEWEALEAAERRRGIPLPFEHRCDAARALAPNPPSLLAVLSPDGECVASATIEVRRLRALPGHRLLRVRRLGASVAPTGAETLAGALAALVRRNPRVLRLDVELFSRDAGHRRAMGAYLARHGFVPAAERNAYASTLVLDLQRPEQEVFAGLDSSARRNVRAAEKRRLVVRPIDDVSLAARMDAMDRDTLARTGGRHVSQDWVARIRLAASHPESSRLVGLFRTDVDGPEALLSFAWGRNHGDHADYAAGASVRSEELRIPLGYAPVWELIRWARGWGAAWFDLGGVTAGAYGNGDDPLGGISSFKRTFSKVEVAVGDEWVLEARTVRAGVARAAHRMLRGARRLGSR